MILIGVYWSTIGHNIRQLRLTRPPRINKWLLKLDNESNEMCLAPLIVAKCPDVSIGLDILAGCFLALVCAQAKQQWASLLLNYMRKQLFCKSNIVQWNHKCNEYSFVFKFFACDHWPNVTVCPTKHNLGH